MIPKTIAVLGFVFPVWCLAQTAPVGQLSQTGQVRSGGVPIPGATISATHGTTSLTTSTDESGHYRLDNLTAGRWMFEVRMPGFQTASREIEVAAGGLIETWMLELAPRPAARPPQARGGQGFQRLAVSPGEDPVESVLAAAAPAPDFTPPPQAGNANEAFLLNGSLSAGLPSGLERGAIEGREFEMRRGEFGGFGPGFGPGAGFGGPGAGLGGPGPGFGSPGAGVGGPGVGPGGPEGRGGGPPGTGGGFAGRGPGGGFGGGPPGRGGVGGPGGRGGARPRGRGPGGPGREGFFGNRAGRGRQGVRGTAFLSSSNSALDARPYSLTGQTVPKASYAQHRFGGMIGGPLAIPKLFRSEKTTFFLSFGGSSGRNPYQAISTLPSPAERSGDFSGRFDAAARIFDPLTRGPFPGDRIPATRIDPAARGLLDFFPAVNQPGAVQNYQYVTSVGNNSRNVGLRLNYNRSAKNRFDVNTNFQWREGSSAQMFGFLDATTGLGSSVSLGWTHNFTRSRINTLRANFNRNRSDVLPFFAYRTDVAAALGIRGVSRDPINYGPPNLTFTNFGSLSDASAQLRRDQTASVAESLLLVRGRHNFSVGGEYRRIELNTRTDQNARGTFGFSGLATSAFNNQNQPVPQTGFDFADFLLGLPQSSSIRFGGSDTYFRGSAVSAFGQDDWRVRGNLSLNLGLRYEFFQPFHEKYNRIANLDLSPLFNAVAVVTPGGSGPFSGRFPRGLIDPDRNNVSPRTGLAWRPFPKRQLQVRLGYSLVHNGSIYNQFPSRLAAQPPFANTATVNTSLGRSLTLRDGFATAPSQDVTNSYAVDRNYRVGYAQTWSVSVQQSLPRYLVVEVSYLGTKGTRLDIQRLPNRAAAGSPLTAEQRRQIGNAVGFTWDTSEGNSIYHAGQVRLTRRFSRGFSGNLSYIWAKSIDNASTLGGGSGVVAQNDKDLRAERGRSSFDQRHAFSASYVLTSPVREGSALFSGSRWAAGLFRDWTLSGGLTASSGTPLTARVLGNQSDTAGTGAIGSGRADATGLSLDEGDGFFNLLAFAIPSPGTFGNSSRNLIDGPSRISLNLSFGRSFTLAERRGVEFRVESQNSTNHVNFTGLGTVVNAINYGLPTATGPMRTVSAVMRLRF